MRNRLNPPDKSTAVQTRRHFLRTTTASVGFACLSFASVRSVGATPTTKYRAAIIGHTGRGDYGHNLDLIFAHRTDVEVVAVADPVAEGRNQAAARTGAARQYADYRKMLEVEKPDLVSVAPRWSDQHRAMALAALQVGSHVFMEKPFMRTLAEADEVLALAAKTSRRIAVAHQMRLSPEVLDLKAQLASGLIGELLELNSVGKQDRRAGGEDLIVLGVHMFDLMRLFAGDPEWCTARVLERGQPITRNSGHPATEDIGPVAGDEVLAQFAFPSGVNATFTSRGRRQEVSGPWGMTLIGSKGTVRILADTQPRIYLCKEDDWSAASRTSRWEMLKGNSTESQSGGKQIKPNTGLANQRLVNDWLDAIAVGREPVCSGRSGMRALEMAHAVFEAAIQGSRVAFPLVNREHPLAKTA